MAKQVKVWSKFSRKTKDDTVLNFRIEEVSDDRLDEAVDLYMDYFAKVEAFQIAAGIDKSEEALKENREVVLKLFRTKPHHVVICCLDEPDKKMDYIGVSVMTIQTKQNKFDNIELRTQEMKKLFESLKNLANIYNAMDAIQLDRFYEDRAVVVHSNYRGLGIATEFFKARRLICKEHGVSMTGAWMTALGSQKAAERDNWETAYEISYEELSRQLGLPFENTSYTCKFMIARVT